MDADHRRILNWLKSKAPRSHPCTKALSGWSWTTSSRAGSAFVAHAVREIWNRLPDEIAPKPGAPRTDYSHLTDEIAARWEEEEELLDTYRPTGLGQFVSIDFLKAVAELLEGRRNAFQNKQTKVERLFTTTVDSPPMEYNVKQWTDIHGWAVRRSSHRHPGRLRPQSRRPPWYRFNPSMYAPTLMTLRPARRLGRRESSPGLGPRPGRACRRQRALRAVRRLARTGDSGHGGYGT